MLPKLFTCRKLPMFPHFEGFLGSLVDEFKSELEYIVLSLETLVLPALAVEVLVDGAESSAFKDLSGEVVIETEPIFIYAIHENHLTPCGRPFLYCTYIIPQNRVFVKGFCKKS